MSDNRDIHTNKSIEDNDNNKIKLTIQEYEDKIAEISNLTFELNKQKNVIKKVNVD